MGNNKYCIALDWLEIILIDETSILENINRNKSEFDLGNGIIAKQTNTINHIGFKQSFLIFLDDENIGYMHYYKKFGFGINFSSTEFCCIEILKLYIATIKALKEKYIKDDNNTLENEFMFISDIIVRKQY